MPEQLSRERMKELTNIFSDDRWHDTRTKRTANRKLGQELLGHIDALEAENERLRAVADAALLMRSACPMDWTHGDCRDSQCAVVCCALDALDKEATDA